MGRKIVSHDKKPQVAKKKSKLKWIIPAAIAAVIAVVAAVLLIQRNLPGKKVTITEYALSNPKATDTTKEVYKYICENFGKVMLSAQQESTWKGSPDYEMDYIKETTGKLPAMRGFDYMNNDYDGVNERAIEWWNNGGLVTICWHTGLKSSGYDEAMADKVDFKNLFTQGTEEYATLMASWDLAATHLLELQEAGVTVLWRPFHEFDGGWFWWGKGGKDNFIRLWQMMYDRFTNYYGLNNLIWVLGYSHEMNSGWYVGDAYCDIIGSDTYDNSTNVYNWNKLTKVGAHDKPYAFHECGKVPAVSEFQEKKCLWSWFMIWHTDWLMDNDKENLKEVYNSDLVITLDELPKFGK